MATKPVYARLARSREFRNKEEAEAWAEDQKNQYQMQGYSVKKEIDFMESTSNWSAKIFIKATGGNSVEQQGKPRP